MKINDADDILISGAGIGGLTAALALAKIGLSVSIFERSPQFEEAGAGIQLSPNASRVLIGLGLEKRLMEVATIPSEINIGRLSSREILARLPVSDIVKAHGAPYLIVRRADLQQILLEAVRRNRDITLRPGHTIERFTSASDGVTANCRSPNDMISEHQSSALIGADGLWSSIRPSTGNALEPHFTGFEAWRTLLPIDRAPAGYDATSVNVCLKLGRGCHVVLYPVNQGRFLNIVAVQHAREPRTHRARFNWSHAGLPAELGDVVRQAESGLAELLRTVDSWQVWSLYDMKPAHMASANVALLGDAAHPILPFMAQGAALAIEDADTLSRCLDKAGGDRTKFGEALAKYARLREKRARKVRKTSLKNAKTYHMGRPFAFVRDRVIRTLGAKGMMRRYKWLYGWKKD